MEKFKTYLINHKKVLVWASVAVATIIVILSGWLIYDTAENRRIDAEAVTLAEDLTIGYGETVKVSDFLANLNGELVDDFKIDTQTLGEVEIEFEYINIKHKKRTRTFKIQIVDETKPIIYGSSAYTVNVGYDGDLTSLMMSGDDLDDNPNRKILGEYDLSKVGHYNLEYIITDNYGNSASKPFTLHVVEPNLSGGAPSTNSSKLPLADLIADHKTDKTKIGIDVSAWQGEIDWQKVKDAGVEFAMIRVGYQVDFGADYVLDRYFERNITEAEKVGLPVGVYFYSYANSIDEAKAQADWIAEKLNGHQVELGVAFDWEDWGDFNNAGMSFTKINQVAQEFIEEVESQGYSGWLYSSKVYLECIWDFVGYEKVWLAQYYDRVTYDGKYQIWQLSNVGRVDGIYGDVDLDIMYLD